MTSKWSVLGTVLVSVGLAGCDLIDQTPGDQTARYQTMRDDRGQLVSFDTITGEATPVEAALPVPTRTVAPAREAVAARTKASSDETDRATSMIDAEPVTVEPEAASISEAPQQAAAAPLSGACVVGQQFRSVELVVSTPADMFVRPEVRPDPVVTLPPTTRVTRLEADGEWLLVRFEDPVWGPRTGYVHCANLALAPTDATG